MEIFVARQPIFDVHLQVCAYEMLFRASAQNAYDGSAGDLATAKVISTLFSCPPCDRLLGGKPAFINFPRSLLVEGAATVLPPEKTVIEILESVEPDAEVQAACARLHAQGYRLALDDFVPTTQSHPLIPPADILKVDFRLASAEQQRRAANRFGGQLELLAEKVETREEFEQAAGMGYRYFQGFFFARPVLTAFRQIEGCRLNYLHILKELHREHLDYRRLTELLRREHALAYMLLRFVNSALFARRETVESIHHALEIIGEDAARKWLSVVVLLDLSADQPPELAVSTLVRARFAEMLAPAAGVGSRSEDCFLMGLFSRLDTMMGRPMEELLDGLHLDEEVTRVLLGRARPGDQLPKIWESVLSYESADWAQLAKLAAALSIPAAVLTPDYAEAVAWADAATHL